MSYPVDVRVDPSLTGRNRLTTFFRFILAIPHMLLVGTAGMGVAWGSRHSVNTGAEGGLFGAIAFCLAIVNWFVILITGVEVTGIRQFTLMYLRWRARALAYVNLLTDQYPPFGDAAYPASFLIEEPPPGPRDRLSVALRLILAIPHLILLVFVTIAWGFVTIASWFIILFTGMLPQGLAQFSIGALRWRLRVDAYMLLLVDEYPPFSLDA